MKCTDNSNGIETTNIKTYIVHSRCWLEIISFEVCTVIYKAICRQYITSIPHYYLHPMKNGFLASREFFSFPQ